MNVRIFTHDCQHGRAGPNSLFNNTFFSSVGYHLRLYHELNGKSVDDIKWLPQGALLLDLFKIEVSEEYIQTFCKKLVDDKVDIIGASVYSWGKGHFNIVLSEVKKRLPNIIIIGGGPELDAHANTKTFFESHPWYDWVIYGDGEEGFTTLLDHIAGYDTALVNVVSNDGTVYPHKVFVDKATMGHSPYLRYRDEFKQVYTDYKNYWLSQEWIGPHQEIVLTWETTKGCPYMCSFCDWSSGLHNKVRVWGIKNEVQNEPNWKKELDLFTEIKVDSIYWTNPNVGTTPQDKDIVDYWCELKRNNPDTPLAKWLQLSKLHKKEAYDIFRKILNAGLENTLQIDLQDLSTEVLDNIDRPTIPWETHKALLKSFIDEFPILQFPFKTKIPSRINYIWGLPGQRLENWDNNLKEAIELKVYAHFFTFELLPNSPAYKKEYQEKFQIKSEKISILARPIPDEIIGDLTPEIIAEYCHPPRLIPTSCYSFDRKTWYTGLLKSYIYKKYITWIHTDPYPFLNNFHRFQHIVDTLFEWFDKYKIIGIYIAGESVLNAHPNESAEIHAIMQELYKDY